MERLYFRTATTACLEMRPPLFLLVLLVATTAPKAQSDDVCSSAEEIENLPPVVALPSDSPAFAPLRWTMARAQARRALGGDGWARRPDSDQSERFTGQMFGRSASVLLDYGPDGRLVRSRVFIFQDPARYWDERIWTEVRSVLEAAYGSPEDEQHILLPSPTGALSCSSFSTVQPEGASRVFAEWPTVDARVYYGCLVSVSYRGPGYREAQRAEELAEAREADLTCRADAARLRRDRDRLAPGTSAPTPR